MERATLAAFLRARRTELAAAHQLGAALTAFTAGALRANFGTYLEAFMLSGLLCIIAALMVLFIGCRSDEATTVLAPAE